MSDGASRPTRYSVVDLPGSAPAGPPMPLRVSTVRSGDATHRPRR
ncbi:hypothetical protein F4560_003008 [Saccharothrix ecbatanensis]|uniref:Uncharacterized protein n=1 Tax=Saccharothrix ecbatanensis TaxID=1105145 RepID=A0A7W9HJG0_9PSEU|nr:hypothetical protein [Saccharothrix ecbatanensis]MBB5803240.1 hypothetical protein [Saccharothrix ecbatanensis]